MLAAESRAEWSFLEWIVDCGRLFENMSECYGGSTEKFGPENGLSCNLNTNECSWVAILHYDNNSILVLKNSPARSDNAVKSMLGSLLFT